MTVEDYRLLEGAAQNLRAAIPAPQRMAEGPKHYKYYDACNALDYVETAYRAVSRIKCGAWSTAYSIYKSEE